MGFFVYTPIMCVVPVVEIHLSSRGKVQEHRVSLQFCQYTDDVPEPRFGLFIRHAVQSRDFYVVGPAQQTESCNQAIADISFIAKKLNQQVWLEATE
jgi:hypothetical protein